MADRGSLERRLIERAATFKANGWDKTPKLLREAADRIRELERAVELSRVWWDDADPYRAAWNHAGFPCDTNPCDACLARKAAILALARPEGGAS